MSVELIQDRLNEYDCKNEQDEENAIKEIVQEIALSGLARHGFFKKAAFQGGTCLRILYRLPRFSEDLDFMLREPDARFEMNEYVLPLRDEFLAYGFDFEIQNRGDAESPLKVAFLKNESWGKILNFHFIGPSRISPKKIKIKIEVDTRPPAGSGFDHKILHFPIPFTVLTQDLPSLFAGKSHALLCRPYVKGRDWYDFLWYARKGVIPNFHFLENAIFQMGPWTGQKIQVDSEWYRTQMEKKIHAIDWNSTRKDVRRFLRQREIVSLDLWSAQFFLDQLKAC